MYPGRGYSAPSPAHADQDPRQGMLPLTVARSFHPNERNQDNPLQTSPEDSLPVILDSVDLTINTNNHHSQRLIYVYLQFEFKEVLHLTDVTISVHLIH